MKSLGEGNGVGEEEQSAGNLIDLRINERFLRNLRESGW